MPDQVTLKPFRKLVDFIFFHNLDSNGSETFYAEGLTRLSGEIRRPVIKVPRKNSHEFNKANLKTFRIAILAR